MVGHRITKIDVVKAWKMNWKVDCKDAYRDNYIGVTRGIEKAIGSYHMI